MAAGAGTSGSLPAGMVGVWDCSLKRSDDISPFLEVVGVPWAVRQIAKRSGVTWTIAAAEGGFTQTNKNSMKETTVTYVFGKAVEVEQADGSKQLSTATLLEGDRIQLATKTPDGKLDVTTVYALEGADLVATISVLCPKKGQVVVRRIFERKA